MGRAPVLEAGEGVQLDPVDGPENAFFNVGVGLFQLPQEELDLLALALPNPVAGGVPGFGKAAGALEKMKFVVIPPADNGVLMDAVQRADQLHAGEVFAAELGGHGLELRAVKKAQQRSLDDIGEVMAQGDFIAA